MAAVVGWGRLPSAGKGTVPVLLIAISAQAYLPKAIFYLISKHPKVSLPVMELTAQGQFAPLCCSIAKLRFACNAQKA